MPKKRDYLVALISGTVIAGGCSLPKFPLPTLKPNTFGSETSTATPETFRVASFRSHDPTPDPPSVQFPAFREIESELTTAEPLPSDPSEDSTGDPKVTNGSGFDPLPTLPQLAQLDTSYKPVELAEGEPMAEPVRTPGEVELNLTAALAAIGGTHPAVGLARWRVEEAYARWDQAKILWLPTINAGVSYHRHDGNYQASNGDIVDVNRSSLQSGLGVGATGAGTTQRPGVVAQYHLADAIFQPDVAKKQAWATQHAADGVNQRQLLQAAIDYQLWLAAHLEQQIVNESRERTSDLAKLTGDFAATGQGLRADADRMQTELALIDDRLLQAAEQIEVTAARVIETLSLPRNQTIVPHEPTITPIEFVTMDSDRDQLIATALATRPELRESRSLVAAACAAHQRQKWAPFVPSVLLGFTTGSFGGGLGNNVDDVDGRYDFDAAIAWQARQMGLGELAARRETSSQVQQARYRVAQVMDQVAREVREFHSQTQFRAQRIERSRNAIKAAEDSYERNLNRIRDGQGLPIETLQSLQALEAAQRAYLQSVVDYNEAQFRLQWAVGWATNIQ